MRAGDPYRTLADLHGHKVGTLKASLGERILQSAGDLVVVGYDEETDAYSDLANGRVDAVLLDYPIALYYATPNAALRLVGEPIGRIRYGIAMRKGDTALRQQIDDALKDVMASGELRRILERWKLWTPTMASELDDFAPSTVAPVMYDHFIAVTAPLSGWRATLLRYAGFLPLMLAKAAVVTLEVSSAWHGCGGRRQGSGWGGGGAPARGGARRWPSATSSMFRDTAGAGQGAVREPRDAQYRRPNPVCRQRAGQNLVLPGLPRRTLGAA